MLSAAAHMHEDHPLLPAHADAGLTRASRSCVDLAEGRPESLRTPPVSTLERVPPVNCATLCTSLDTARNILAVGCI